MSGTRSNGKCKPTAARNIEHARHRSTIGRQTSTTSGVRPTAKTRGLRTTGRAWSIARIGPSHAEIALAAPMRESLSCGGGATRGRRRSHAQHVVREGSADFHTLRRGDGGWTRWRTTCSEVEDAVSARRHCWRTCSANGGSGLGVKWPIVMRSTFLDMDTCGVRSSLAGGTWPEVFADGRSQDIAQPRAGDMLDPRRGRQSRSAARGRSERFWRTPRVQLIIDQQDLPLTVEPSLQIARTNESKACETSAPTILPETSSLVGPARLADHLFASLVMSMEARKETHSIAGNPPWANGLGAWRRLVQRFDLASAHAAQRRPRATSILYCIVPR